MFFLKIYFRPKLLPIKFQHNATFRNVSWFAKVPMAKPDEIFSLVEDFAKDSNKNKVNLAIGVYRTDDGKAYVLKCVRKAEKSILKKKLDKDYPNVFGPSCLCKLALDFTLGKDSPYNKPGRNVTFQALSGNGGLSIIAQFLRLFHNGPKTIYIPFPTWPNHSNLFHLCGLKHCNYRYYDSKNINLDFKGMMEDIGKMPEKSIVLLCTAGHNPTGVDPNIEQWYEIADKVKKKNLYVIMDNAYQGFATGDVEKDSCPLKILSKKNINFAVATSFSKNMGLYGERVGVTSFLVDCKEEADRVASNLVLLIRANHSNPPLQGARIVTEVMSNPELRKEWYEEIKLMSNRLKNIRKDLVKALKKAGSKRNWDFITKQIGMFSFIGLKEKDMIKLRKEYHIYGLNNGRIAMSGINSKNVEYVAQSLHKLTSK